MNSTLLMEERCFRNPWNKLLRDISSNDFDMGNVEIISGRLEEEKLSYIISAIDIHAI